MYKLLNTYTMFQYSNVLIRGQFIQLSQKDCLILWIHKSFHFHGKVRCLNLYIFMSYLLAGFASLL